MSVYVYTCLYRQMYTYVYIYIGIYVYIYIYTYVCVYKSIYILNIILSHSLSLSFSLSLYIFFSYTCISIFLEYGQRPSYESKCSFWPPPGKIMILIVIGTMSYNYSYIRRQIIVVIITMVGKLCLSVFQKTMIVCISEEDKCLYFGRR